MFLDRDNLKQGLTWDLGFSETERIENIRQVAEVANLMNDADLIVLTAFISPFKSNRENAKQLIGDNFIEIYVKEPLKIVE